MSEVSSGRRRLGIVAITTTALALPLTASISYAQAEPPMPPETEEHVIETIDPDAAPGEGHRVVRIERRTADGDHAEIDAEHERHVEVHVVRNGETGEETERRVIRRHVRHDGEEMSEAEIEQMMAELEREFESIDGEIETAIEIAMAASEEALEGMEHRVIMFDSEGDSHNLEINCDGGDTVVERELEDGRHAMVICRASIRAEALQGLREARDEIRNDPDIPEHLREEILRSLERSMEQMSHNRERQLHVQAKAQARAAAAAASTRSAAVAMRWQGRMVSPIRVVAPLPAAPPAPPAPAADADCDDHIGTA